MPEVYFEDLSEGEATEFGSYEVTETEIKRFAGQYDPQPFHVDSGAAAESMFGGLIASGWHTAAVCMRLLVDGHLADAASLGAIGVDELRWPNPTRPGDVLSVEFEVLQKRISDSHPERGLVRSQVTGMDSGGEVKLEMRPLALYARRTVVE